MGKKNHKLFVVVFLYIIISSGFPVLSFPFPDFDGTKLFGWELINGNWLQVLNTIETNEVSPVDFFSNVLINPIIQNNL